MHLRLLRKCVSLEALVQRPKPSSKPYYFQILSFLNSIADKNAPNHHPSSTSHERDHLIEESCCSSAVKLFQDCGFSKTQIETIVSRHPHYLRSNPERILKPKISFFQSIGLAPCDITKLIASSRNLLRRSAENHMSPSFDLLKHVLGGGHHAVEAIKRNSALLSYDIPGKLEPNISILRKAGASEPQISKMITTHMCARGILCTKPDRFRQVVESLMQMGFDVSSSSFIHALSAMTFYSASTWEEKLKYYESLGFSSSQVLAMFRKKQCIMMMSNARMQEYVEFYKTRFHWSPSDLAFRPHLMNYSLEKRIILRCSALQILWSRNMIRRVKLLSVLVITEKAFLDAYVNKQAGEVPQVLDAYQGKLQFEEYNFVL